jgi:large subunit ribosomal protein L21
MIGRPVADYAVIALGGKQYRVREGQRLLVDRLDHEEGATFGPAVLAMGDGDGLTDGGAVTARVEEHLLGKKIQVFTYKPKRNSRRGRGHRSRLSRILIESIGDRASAPAGEGG